MSVPDPATVDWVPLYNLQSAIPPVVNGQWVKGVGGAAVWSAITPADISGYPADARKALLGDGTWGPAMRQFGGSYSAGDVKMQVGRVDGLTLPAGDPATLDVTLITAWPNAHVAFFASIWPGAHWNLYCRAPGLPNGLTKGSTGWYNATSQGVTVFYVSYGW